MSRVTVLRFLPLSLRVETYGGLATVLIDRGTPLPVEREETLYPAEGGQTAANAQVLLGERPVREGNLLLGAIQFDGLPTKAGRKPSIKIKLSVDRHGIVRYRASVEGTGITSEDSFQIPQHAITPAQIEKHLAEVEAAQPSDAERVAQVRLENRANENLQMAEELLSRLRSYPASQQKAEALASLIGKTGLALQSGDPRKIEAATAELEAMTLRSDVIVQDAFAGLAQLFATRPQPRAPAKTTKHQRQSSTGKSKPVIFLVHGHDEGAREGAARQLERYGLEVIVLHEKPNAGRTLIEKLEAHSDVSYAVVLLTPDDVGRARGAKRLVSRARQNVVLELGLFLGKLGRARVCALHRADIELPSDINGLVYIKMDDAGAWRLALGRELQAAGIQVDLARAI